jgi:hypothetical protein
MSAWWAPPAGAAEEDDDAIVRVRDRTAQDSCVLELELGTRSAMGAGVWRGEECRGRRKHNKKSNRHTHIDEGWCGISTLTSVYVGPCNKCVLLYGGNTIHTE